MGLYVKVVRVLNYSKFWIDEWTDGQGTIRVGMGQI